MDKNTFVGKFLKIRIMKLLDIVIPSARTALFTTYLKNSVISVLCTSF